MDIFTYSRKIHILCSTVTLILGLCWSVWPALSPEAMLTSMLLPKTISEFVVLGSRGLCWSTRPVLPAEITWTPRSGITTFGLVVTWKPCFCQNLPDLWSVLSPGSTTLSGYKILPRAMSGSVIQLQGSICWCLWPLSPQETKAIKRNKFRGLCWIGSSVLWPWES